MKCRLLRLRISSRLDDGRPLPKRLERHLSQCPQCAAWHRTQLDLSRNLRRSASAATSVLADPPPFLLTNIQRAVRSSRQEHAPLFAGGMWHGAAAATAGLVLLGGIALFSLRQGTNIPDPAPQDSMAQNHSSAPGAETVSVPEEASEKSRHQNPLLLAAAGLDGPLRREMALLGEDARAAIHALKEGFLPGGLRPQ